jgi:hypothetical protein
MLVDIDDGFRVSSWMIIKYRTVKNKEYTLEYEF